MLQNRLFSALASRSGFGAAISDAVALSSIVICNSVSADRIGVAASRLLAAAAACVILLSFAAEDCKSYWEWLHPGCDSHLSADFRNFGASNFPFKIPFKKCFQNRLFVALASRSGFGAAISDAVARSSIVFCNSVLCRSHWSCVILLSFAAEDCKSYWSGCIQAAIVICQQIFRNFGASNFPFKIPFKNASKSSFFCFGVEIRF